MSERGHRLYSIEIPEVKRGLKLRLRELCEAEETVEMAHRLWREEGLFCGMSAGASVLIALRVAARAVHDRGALRDLTGPLPYNPHLFLVGGQEPAS